MNTSPPKTVNKDDKGLHTILQKEDRTLRGAEERSDASSLNNPVNLQHVLAMSSVLDTKGYVKTPFKMLDRKTCDNISQTIMPKLFRGDFETGVYPDEWHWREGISRNEAVREICNAWKADRTIASIVLNEEMGKLVSNVMGWDSVRLAQDDLVWKPPYYFVEGSDEKINNDSNKQEKRIDTVGFHQDSAYISRQFLPYENNSITVWFALDDADEENGCLEYVAKSHLWRPILHCCSLDESDSVTESFHTSDECNYRNSIRTAANVAGVQYNGDEIENATVESGYAVFHHQDVWHGSGPNLSTTRHRRALVAHYLRGDVVFCGDHKACGPWGKSSYIYGRYRRYGSQEVDESFFPVVYSKSEYKLKRSIWIDDYIKK